MHDENLSPLSTTEMLVSPTPRKLSLPGDIENMAGDDVVSKPTRLTEKYRNAYSDFYDSGTPCVYKSGPDWPVRKAPLAQSIVREPRPASSHHTRSLPPSPSRSSYLSAHCQYQCHGSLFTLVFFLFFSFHIWLTPSILDI